MEHCGSARWVASDHPRSEAAVSTVVSDEAFGQIQPCQVCRQIPSKHSAPQVSGPQFPRRTPESNRTAAAAKIARIQASIAALGDEDPEEVELLKKALMKAELQAKTPPLETQIAHAVQFIERAKKRVAGADEKIRKAAEALRQAEAEKVADIQAIAEAEAQVERLRVQSVQPVAPPTVVRGQDMEAEVTRLRAQVVQLQAQAQNAAVKRRAVGSSGGDIPIMPNHVPGELSAWMEDGHADLLVAMNGGDRSRVQEFSTMISAGLDRLTELTGGMES